MKKIIIRITISITAFLGLNSCYYDIESELYTGNSGSCDTTNITYEVTISSIIQNNACLSCHGGTGAAGGGFVLDNYNALKIYAQNGRLYGAINHEPGFSPMPKGGNKLSACEILKLKKWIDAGIPNN